MSALLATFDERLRVSRPRLRALMRRPKPLARMPFLITLGAILALGMVGILLLNTVLQNQAFEVSRARQEATRLEYQVASLEVEVNRARSPQQVAAEASRLGMRANPDAIFLVLADGTILGEPTPVTGEEVPSLIVKTPEQIAAEEAAAAAAAQAEAEAQAAAAAAAAQAAAQAQADAAAQAQAQADAAAQAQIQAAAVATGTQQAATTTVTR